MLSKFNKYVVVGSASHPAETTVSAPDVKVMREVVEHFLPEGSMWREGDKVEIHVYAPGQDVPDDVARHVV